MKNVRRIKGGRLYRLLLGLCLCGLVFAYGVAVGEYKIFPHSLLRAGFNGLIDLRDNWKSYAGIRPTKFLVPSTGGAGVTIHDVARAYAGLTHVAGLFEGHASIQLMDMDGKVVHRWIPDFDEVWRGIEADPSLMVGRPMNEWDNEILGGAILPNGDAIMNYGSVLVKIDRCNNILWKRMYGTHHTVEFAEDGTFWIAAQGIHDVANPAFPAVSPPYVEDIVMRVSTDGEILETISLPDLLVKNGMLGNLFPKGMIHNPKPGYNYDLTHLNDIEELTTAMAGRFPMFAAGDLLISMRDVNLVLVFDPVTQKVKWSQTGPWVRQHDPDFLPDGLISVFNNNNDGTHEGRHWGGSNIMLIDPSTHAASVVIPGSGDFLFYTYEAGSHQWLENGNVLVTESTGGRILEIAPDGTVVWQYDSVYDPETALRIQHANRLPEGYFNFESWACDQVSGS